MREQGFVNHCLMGAFLLGGLWLALYLPHVIVEFRVGGVPAAIAIAAGVIGVIGAPVLLIITEGDEMFGIIGIVAALAVGWIAARIAMTLEASPRAIESARLCGAALGPILLFAGFSALAWVVERRENRPPASTQDKGH